MMYTYEQVLDYVDASGMSKFKCLRVDEHKKPYKNRFDNSVALCRKIRDPQFCCHRYFKVYSDNKDLMEPLVVSHKNLSGQEETTQVGWKLNLNAPKKEGGNTTNRNNLKKLVKEHLDKYHTFADLSTITANGHFYETLVSSPAKKRKANEGIVMDGNDHDGYDNSDSVEE